MNIFANRFLIVNAAINDSIKSKFIVDTGNGIELVSGKFFERIKSSTKPAGIFTGFQSIGTRVDLELFRIPSIQLGNYKKNDILLVPYPPLDDAVGIDGIISMKLFENQVITMDFKSQQLILETDESGEKIAD